MVLFLSLSGQIEAQSTISVILPGFSLSVAQDMAGISRGEDGGELAVESILIGKPMKHAASEAAAAENFVTSELGRGAGGVTRLYDELHALVSHKVASL